MPDDNPEEDDWLSGYQLADLPHPGLFLQTGIIRGRGLSVGEAFSLSMDTLMRIQCAYDGRQMRARADDVDMLPFVPKPKPGQASPV